MSTYFKNFGNTVRIVEAEPAVRKKTAVKVRRRRSVTYVYKNDHRHKLSPLTVITLTLIFAGAACTAASYAKVSVANQTVISLTNQLRETQSQNEALAKEATRFDDAVSMRDIAENKLGMSEPKPYQIRHITVPEENYAEYNK